MHNSHHSCAESSECENQTTIITELKIRRSSALALKCGSSVFKTQAELSRLTIIIRLGVRIAAGEQKRKRERWGRGRGGENVCVRVYGHVCVCVCRRARAHTHTHTHTRAHTRTHTHNRTTEVPETRWPRTDELITVLSEGVNEVLF